MQPGNRAGQLAIWFLWERVFPSDYKCSREIEPDNWPEIEQDNWPVVRLDFPAAFVVRWKNAFPQEPLVVGSRTRRV